MDQRSITWAQNYDPSVNVNYHPESNLSCPNNRITCGEPFTPTFSGAKFLAVFTTSHLTISLLFIGLVVLLFGILSCVVSKFLYVTSDPLAGQAFHTIGVACICISIVLVFTAVGIMIMAIRWARRKVYSLPQQQMQFKHHHHHHHYPSISSTSIQQSPDSPFSNPTPTAPPPSAS